METIFISTSMPGRARPDYFFELGNSFSMDGYRVIVIIDGNPQTLPTHERMIFLKWPSKRPTKLKDFSFLRKLIIEYKPSVLISSFGSVNIMNICGYFLKVKNRINYILSVSEPFYEKVGYIQILNRAFLKQRKTKVYRLATLMVCNSAGTEQDSIDYYGLQNMRFLVLHNLIKKSLVQYKSREERKNQILIVGNLIKRKGHRVLFNQFKKTLEFYPTLKLIVIGDGSEKKDLMLQIKKMQIDENVEFVGNITNKNISSWFSDSLISISASIHEAFGFINIEAMREGTPIISTPTAGAMDILKENENGEFFTLDNVDSLTKAVDKILFNWKFFSDNALKSFNNSYSLETQINTHRELLKKRLR